jgi:hypothetical protein
MNRTPSTITFKKYQACLDKYIIFVAVNQN